MILLVLAYVGGVLTIVSPCVLPVLPFVFARADQPFVRTGLPLLAGMAVTFTIVATLAAVGGGWAVAANQYGRIAAMVLLAAFGLALLSRTLADWMTRPLVAFASRLSAAPAGSSPVTSSFVLGMATGFLWAPCAGPILGLILTGAALQGASGQTSLFLLAYALGAATSLAIVLLAGGRVVSILKRSLGAGEWIRRAMGAVVLVAVAAIALGFDTGLLTQLSTANTTMLEQKLIEHVLPTSRPTNTQVAGQPYNEGRFPRLAGATEWINSPPLSPETLRGKVVVVDFWTYSCINCLRSLPYIEAWDAKYRDHGLVIIGVHTPEFAFEKDLDNVKKAVASLGVRYPVAVDNGYTIWGRFHNMYWPAHYFIDAQGFIRDHDFGEGNYESSERMIQALLRENGDPAVPGGYVTPNGSGVEAAASGGAETSPETYLGYNRADNFVATDAVVRDGAHTYSVPEHLALNQWGLEGAWTVGPEHAMLDSAPGRIVFRFRARDLHMVLGPAENGKPIRFRIRIDGAAPGDDHGIDVDSNGEGTVTEERLYQLVRQSRDAGERTFDIEFLDPGVAAYTFTFG